MYDRYMWDMKICTPENVMYNEGVARVVHDIWGCTYLHVPQCTYRTFVLYHVSYNRPKTEGASIISRLHVHHVVTSKPTEALWRHQTIDNDVIVIMYHSWQWDMKNCTTVDIMLKCTEQWYNYKYTKTKQLTPICCHWPHLGKCQVRILCG